MKLVINLVLVSDSDDDSPSKRYGSIKVSLIKDEIKNQQV